MKTSTLLQFLGRALVVASATVAPIAIGQTGAAAGSARVSGLDTVMAQESGAVVDGTIPAARPGLPELQRGAQGPIRPDALSESRTDPSVRDTDPLTMNGLWETKPGNVVIGAPH
jgi:hypothetical protein